MPYPRLLVGSVAPRGGRNARRARAMATNSRRLSPAAPSSLPSPSLPQLAQAIPPPDTSINGKLSSSGSGGSPVSSDEQAASNECGITISTEDLARDPEGTLKAAAAALGVTIQEAATLVAGVQLPGLTGPVPVVAPAATIAGLPRLTVPWHLPRRRATARFEHRQAPDGQFHAHIRQVGAPCRHRWFTQKLLRHSLAKGAWRRKDLPRSAELAVEARSWIKKDFPQNVFVVSRQPTMMLQHWTSTANWLPLRLSPLPKWTRWSLTMWSTPA